jgi:hypothetical protein
MRVLVCGGRSFHKAELLAKTLLALHRTTPFTLVIHGAATGADSLAGAWALTHRVNVLRYPPAWTKHGRQSGAIRNRQMIIEGRPDLVVAFPGGPGTRDIVAQATAAGIRVIEVEIPRREPPVLRIPRD